MYNNSVYASLEVAQGYATTHEEVITLYEYIEMMYKVEKKNRQALWLQKTRASKPQTRCKNLWQTSEH